MSKDNMTLKILKFPEDRDSGVCQFHIPEYIDNERVYSQWIYQVWHSTGSKNGHVFDICPECFGKLTGIIFAEEFEKESST